MFSPYSSYFVGYEPFKLLFYNILMVPCPGKNSVRGFEFTFIRALYERSWAVGCQLQIRGVPVSSTSLPNSTKPLSCRTGLIIKIFFFTLFRRVWSLSHIRCNLQKSDWQIIYNLFFSYTSFWLCFLLLNTISSVCSKIQVLHFGISLLLMLLLFFGTLYPLSIRTCSSLAI